MDPITIVLILTSTSALIVSLLTHIRHSSCFGINIDTRTPPHNSPDIPFHFDNAKTPLLQKSEPININKKEEKRVYL